MLHTSETSVLRKRRESSLTDRRAHSGTRPAVDRSGPVRGTSPSPTPHARDPTNRRQAAFLSRLNLEAARANSSHGSAAKHHVSLAAKPRSHRTVSRGPAKGRQPFLSPARKAPK